MTDEMQLRHEIGQLVKLIRDESLEFGTHREIWSHIKKQFNGKSQQICDLAELQERREYAKQMLREAVAEREAMKNWWPKHTNGPSLPTTQPVREAKKLVWPPRTNF